MTCREAASVGGLVIFVDALVCQDFFIKFELLNQAGAGRFPSPMAGFGIHSGPI